MRQIEQNDVQNQQNIQFENAMSREGMFIEGESEYVQLSNGYFAFDKTGDGNLDGYLDIKAYVKFNINGVRGEWPVQNGEAMSLVGYEEIEEGGVYNMYRLDTNGDRVGEPIDIYSEEYYQIWFDISSYSTYIQVKKVIDQYHELGRMHRQDAYILSEGVQYNKIIKLNQIMTIVEGEGLSGFGGRLILRYYQEGILLDQCVDPRLERLGDPVTVEEVQGYLSEGWIDEELAQKCIKLIEERDRSNEDRVQDEVGVVEGVQRELEELEDDFRSNP